MCIKKNYNPLSFSLNYNFDKSPHTSNKNNSGINCVLIFIFFCIFSAFFNFQVFAFSFVMISNIFFLINFIFKFYIFFTYLKITKNKVVTNKLPLNAKLDLPIYTILLPCFRETEETLYNLIQSLLKLNYPLEKLDVKFLLEEDDNFTIKNLSKIKHNFEVLLIPHALPKTKPKACNFGLYFAKGEFVVVYDAEDRPEPDQLLKALHTFENNDKNVICLQAKLNFYNTHKNILSHCFSIEYLAWFNAFLPAIVKMNFFIPLGGTSNHFKTHKLIEIGGWDSYNVTEDAELGIRIAKYGYKSNVLDSYTLEEAPFKVQDWIFQRVRWMKGYLQTFLVHITDLEGNKNLSFQNICGIFNLIGLSFLSFFLLPITIILMQFLNIENIFLISFLMFNAISIIFYVIMFFIIIKKENFFNYCSSEFLMPLYFLLHCLASILALWQFITKPFYWNKTRHSVK